MTRAVLSRFLRWLVARATPRDEYDFVIGDLEEERHAREATDGTRAATWWYARQVLASLWPLGLRRFATRHRAAGEDASRASMWTDTIGDLRYAVRIARRGPLLSTALVGTMVLGIAVTTAIFSVIDGVVLKPLPFANSDRVVRLGMVIRSGEFFPNVAYPDLEDYRARTTRFDAFAGVAEDEVTLAGDGEPTRVRVAAIDEGYADVFGARAVLGRLFERGEFEYGADKVVLLTHCFWESRFNGDRTIVGRTIVLDDEPRVVVGVLAPSAFSYPDAKTAALVPMAPAPKSWMRNRGAMWLGAVARVKRGVSLPDARADLSAVADDVARRFPDANTGLHVRIEPLHDVIAGPVRQMLVLLGAAVSAVLLIACGNVANLLLGHSQARARELAVRAALGGSASRLRRQQLVESLLLAVSGGIVGVALAPLVIRALIAIYPGELPRAGEVHLDLRVLLFALASTLVAAVLAGTPAAMRVAALDLVRDLRGGLRVAASLTRWNAALVVVQVAASVTLVSAAALLTQSFVGLVRSDPGFRPSGVITFQLTATPARYPSVVAERQFFSGVLDAMRAIPGVRAAASTSHLPFGGGGRRDVYERVGKGDLPAKLPMAVVGVVSPDYFRTMGMPLIRGRGIAVTDVADGHRVVVIDETLARRQYPSDDPVGRTIDWNAARWEIVGIVRAIRASDLADEPYPELYAPSTQLPMRTQYITVATALPPSQLLPAIRRAMRQIDPTIALTDLSTMDALIGDSLAPQRFRAALVGSLGALALLLSVFGIYGVVAYAVTRKTREIGIRMALGESARRVQGRVVLDALRLGVVGIALGVATAIGASRWLRAFVTGVSPTSAPVLLAVAASAIFVVIAAAYGPALRASRIDPALAMKSE